MGMDPVTGNLIGAGMSAAGNMMGANAQANAAKEGLKEQRYQFDKTFKFEKENSEYRKAAYRKALEQGRTDLGTFGTAALSEMDKENPELDQMEEDISAGTADQLQQGTAQMGANLAMQGVRGGQAATLMNRGTGAQAIQAQRDVNEMKYGDAAQRAAEKRAYLAALAKAGQSAGSPATGVAV